MHVFAVLEIEESAKIFAVVFDGDLRIRTLDVQPVKSFHRKQLRALVARIGKVERDRLRQAYLDGLPFRVFLRGAGKHVYHFRIAVLRVERKDTPLRKFRVRRRLVKHLLFELFFLHTHRLRRGKAVCRSMQGLVRKFASRKRNGKIVERCFRLFVPAVVRLWFFLLRRAAEYAQAQRQCQQKRRDFSCLIFHSFAPFSFSMFRLPVAVFSALPFQ